MERHTNYNEAAFTNIIRRLVRVTMELDKRIEQKTITKKQEKDKLLKSKIKKKRKYEMCPMNEFSNSIRTKIFRT